MKLKLNLESKGKYYLFGKTKVSKKLLEDEIKSERVQFMINHGMMLLADQGDDSEQIETDEFGTKHYENIIAHVTDIDLENEYITIDDKSIRKKYTERLKKIKEAEVARICVNVYGFSRVTFFGRSLDFTLTGFKLKG